jgi:hypothetical protein
VLQESSSQERAIALPKNEFGKVLGEASQKADRVYEFPLVYVKPLVHGASFSETEAETFSVDTENPYASRCHTLEKIAHIDSWLSMIWDIVQQSFGVKLCRILIGGKG